MSRDRAERIALTEAAFRIANDRMASWEEASADAAELYFCECSQLECREKVSLTREQYERLRADPQHFVVVPGHEVPDVETVVATDPAHYVVEKPDAVAHITHGADPRADEPGPERAEAEEIAAEIAAPGEPAPDPGGAAEDR
jgi:hypothetical protein